MIAAPISRFVYCSILMFCSVATYAQESAPLWKWYQSGFYSPSLGTDDVLIRTGKAHVTLNDKKVSIKFDERDFPELKGTFSGNIAASGEVNGLLDAFFFHGVEARVGTYREIKIKDCHIQEILLRPTAPDGVGSVLLVSRTQGKCQ